MSFYVNNNGSVVYVSDGDARNPVSGSNQSQNSSVSGNDVLSGQSDNQYDMYPTQALGELAQAISNIVPGNQYPNSTAVNVLRDVIDNLDGTPGYFVTAPDSSGRVQMYYSYDWDVSGQTINLKSPVTLCDYYQYRNGNYDTQYTYTVTTVGDQSISPGSRLVYTNLLPGYPDLRDKAKHRLSSMSVILVGLVGFIALRMLFSRFSRKE